MIPGALGAVLVDLFETVAIKRNHNASADDPFESTIERSHVCTDGCPEGFKGAVNLTQLVGFLHDSSELLP